jgi:uncharacterized protein YrrD
LPRGRDLIGLPVLTGRHMRRIGQVQEVLLSGDGTRICGLVLDGGGWLHQRRVLDFAAVRAVGQTHLLAEAECYLSGEPSAPHSPDQTHSCEELRGMPVLRESGEEVGTLDDVYFEPQSGRVTALQLSRGLVDDLLSGKEILPVDGAITTGEAVILLGDPGDLSGGGSGEMS